MGNIILSRLDSLTCKFNKLKKVVCALEDGGGVETDPVFLASPAFDITNTNVTDLNALSSTYVHKTGAVDESIDGNKTFTGNTTTALINLGGNIVPTLNATYTLGTNTVYLGNAYSARFTSLEFLNETASSTYFGSTLSSQRVLFRMGTSSQIAGGFHLTTGDFFTQSIGAVSTDNLAGVQFNNNKTAASAIARTVYIGGTLTAAANNDVLVGLDISPTFTAGAFTGVIPYAIRHTGSVAPSVDSTYGLGFSTAKYANVYTLAVNSGGTSLGLIASAIRALNVYTSGRIGIQNGGTYTDDTVNQLQVTGTSRFTGNVTLAGDIIPEASGTRSIGSSTFRLNNIFPTNILKGSAGSSMNMGLTNTSDIFFRVQPTTNNIHIQATGTAPTETGYKLTVDGTGATNGGLSIIGATLFNGKITNNNDIESTGTSTGLILKDTGDSSRRRLTIDNGVVVISAAL